MTGPPATRDQPLEAGSQIAGYRIGSVLGRGGMGVVYLAERPEGGQCALKVLSPQLRMDPGFVARFKREAQYAAGLAHPHILDLYDAGETPDGTLYLAMQYAPGSDLGALLARDGVMDLARAVSILGQVGEALDGAHAKGLVHRDVKPANIIVVEPAGSGPYAYLTDFGLSKNPSEDSIALTKKGQMIGTMAYAAPEEILGEARDHLIDIYSLGCVLYEALAGAPPFVRDRDLDVLYAHIGDPRPHVTEHRADLPAEIDAVVARAMAIAPADRFASAAELIGAARALLPGGDMPATGPAIPPVHPVLPPALEAVPPTPLSVEVAPEPSTALRLVVRAGFGLGRELIVGDELDLGRLGTLDGALERDRGISRRHARIYRVDDGSFLVEDEGSANGTFVNQVRIAGPHALRAGDELQVGSTVFAAMGAASPAQTQEPPAEPLSAIAPSDAGAAAVEAQAPAPSSPATAADAAISVGRPLPAAEELPDLEAAPDAAESGGHPETAGVGEPPSPARRLALRLEVDLDRGELLIAIEDGVTARIVRDGDDWRVDGP
jgi:serine/threonine-protein kinase